MKAITLALLAIYFVGGCAITATHNDSLQVREISFSCANGESLAVRFFINQGVAELLRNGQNTELQQKPSGSGFLYSNGPNSIRGKGHDLTVEIGRMAPIQCKAR